MSTTILTHLPQAKVQSYTDMYLSEGATTVTPVTTGPDEVMLVIVFPDQATLHAALGPDTAADSGGGVSG